MDQRKELRELIEMNLESALAKQVEAGEVLAEISRIVGNGSSRTGVRTSVDHRGLVTDVVLSERAVDLPLDELRTEVLSSIEAARADVRYQAAPLQALLVTDPRPLEDQTEVLDALDALVRGGTPTTDPTTDPTAGDRS